MKGFDRISRELNEITKKAKNLKLDNLGNVTFDYEEQELIRRVFKSVFSQLKSARDKTTTKSVLRKTRWIDA